MASGKGKGRPIKGMILLPKGNRILEETIKNIFARKPEENKSPPTHLCDFDEVNYEIKVHPADAPEKLIVSVGCPAYHEIKEHSDAALKAQFPDYECPADLVGAGYDCAIAVPLAEACELEETKKEELVKKIANIKFTVLSGPFRKYFGECREGTTASEPLSFNLRSDTQVTLSPGDGRVVCIFAIDFQDKVDKVIARVFMQELADARRRIRSAPPFKWSTNPPSELSITENPGILGYASIAVMKSHVTGSKEDDVIATMIDFRTFIQYHLKCAKSYFHSRMRKRCSDLLKILNRAKVQFGKKEKKTKTGKTFKRS